MFQTEGDVRFWVREASNGHARWVEHARGGTVGLPDCWVPCRGTLTSVHLELKLGEIKGSELCFTIRPEQRREIFAMVRDNVPVGLLVGIKGSETAMFIPPVKGVLFGRMEIPCPSAYLAVGRANYSLWNGVDHLRRFAEAQLPHP
jgi:hypothetical protein